MEVLLVITWLFFTVGVGLLASARGRNGFLYAVFALIFSPLVAGIVLMVQRDLAVEQERAEAERRAHEVRLEEIRALRGAPDRGARGMAVRPTWSGFSKPDAPEGAVVDDLARLAGMRAAGALTEEEYALLKARLIK